jgi:hypothetical protein
MRTPTTTCTPTRYADLLIEAAPFDFLYDPNEVGRGQVVECWISQGPRAVDPSFDPQPGDWVLAGDEEETPVTAQVLRRDDDLVSLQLQLPSPASTRA